MSMGEQFYQQEVSKGLSTLPWLTAIQEDGLSDLMRLGFPTRHTEDWKYTTLDTFLKQPFSHEGVYASSGPRTALTNAREFRIVNGVTEGVETLQGYLPSGVLVLPLLQALKEHADKLKPYLNGLLQHQHGFQALNTAMLHSGFFIYVPQGVVIKEPICLMHWQDKALNAAYLRHVVVLERGSALTLVEEYHGDLETSYFTSVVTEAYLKPDAQLSHYKIECESKLAYHVGEIIVKQAASSQFNSHSLAVGGKWVRSDTTIHLQEPYAACLMNGIYAPGDGQHIDHHTLVTHDVPNCTSVENYKGILNGHSRAVFNGKVMVARHAVHTKAEQQNKNLLLSKDAEIDTKPQLDIYADDVLCSHGATVGQLDEEALFYLATRGISPALARQFLVEAFAEDNLQRFQHDELAAQARQLLRQQIG